MKTVVCNTILATTLNTIILILFMILAIAFITCKIYIWEAYSWALCSAWQCRLCRPVYCGYRVPRHAQREGL